MKTHQLIHLDSGNTEYYTPMWIVNLARKIMRGIDLDPASSAAANERIQAHFFYDEESDGLAHQWHGRVWMNHPFSRKGNQLWPKKLIEEFESGRVSEACCITFAATSEAWFQGLARYPQCFLCPRIHYCLPSGKKKTGVTKGSVVTYMGRTWEGIDRFTEAFSPHGAVKIAASMMAALR